MTETNPTTTGVSFLAGAVFGLLLVAPAVFDILTSLPHPSSLGPLGSVLVGGVLALLAFVLGMFLLYLGFLAFE